IAQANPVKHPIDYALYAYHGINCRGGGITIIRGSVYSGGPIDSNCSLWVQEVQGGNVDYGDILVYPAGQQWNRGGGNCGAIMSGKPSNAICSDGYEESGSPAACARPFSDGGTSYLKAYQLQSVNGAPPPNPMPCPDSVDAPSWDRMTPDPNYGPSAAV